MKKLLVLIAVLGGTVLSVFGGALVAGWFLVVGVATWLMKKVAAHNKLRRPIMLLFLLTFVGVLAWVWRTGDGTEPRSIASSTWPLYQRESTAAADALRTANLTPQLDELAQKKRDLEQEIFKLRSQANAVERALALKAAADGLITYAQGSNLPMGEVIDAKRAVDEALEKRHLDSGSALKVQKQSLDDFLRAAVAKSSQLTDAAQAQEYLTDFRLRAREIGIDDVNGRMLKLESAILQLRRDAITKDISIRSELSAIVDPATKRLVRQTTVTLSSSNLDLKSIDASELLLDAEPTAISQTLHVRFGDDASAPTAVNTPQSISVNPGIKAVTLIRRTEVDQEFKPVPTPLRLPLFEFQSFTLKWPPPRALKVRAIIDLSKEKGPDQFPFVFDLPGDAQIVAIRLPANSVYMATYSFKATRREGDVDVFETNEDLKPSYFSLRNHLYFEVMPDSPLARNSVVQGWKDFLFPENLAATIAVALCAAVIAVALP